MTDKITFCDKIKFEDQDMKDKDSLFNDVWIVEFFRLQIIEFKTYSLQVESSLPKNKSQSVPIVILQSTRLENKPSRPSSPPWTKVRVILTTVVNNGTSISQR